MTRSVRIAVVLALFAAAGCSSDAGDLVVTRVADLKPVPFAELSERIAETNGQLVDELADTATAADPDWLGPCYHEECRTEPEDDSLTDDMDFGYPSDTVIASPSAVEHLRDLASNAVSSVKECDGYVVYLIWAITGGSTKKGLHYNELHVDGPDVASRFIEAAGAPVIAGCAAELDPTHWS